ncbi:hypothetical protein DL95DRAFT_103466 [Leptodontidium sp. 2 PMI_412]|nr:hypothetical protein DL95DRAFT_103466 [Leptodontidium sp. 2 PMI_412]
MTARFSRQTLLLIALAPKPQHQTSYWTSASSKIYLQLLICNVADYYNGNALGPVRLFSRSVMFSLSAVSKARPSSSVRQYCKYCAKVPGVVTHQTHPIPSPTQ